MKVKSREYKVMLRKDRFSQRKPAVEAFSSELANLAGHLNLSLTGEFRAPEKRTIRFFDTTDTTFRRNGFVLRQRELHGTPHSQVTLKRRSPDRYLAAGVDLAVDEKWDSEEKFEEDIAAVFRSRFSHSQTIQAKSNKLPAFEKLKQASGVFPVLGLVQRDGRICPPRTTLTCVNGVVASERVYKGMSIDFGDKEASLALIVWTLGFRGRPLVAEFSFRYKSKKESYSAELAKSARDFFFALQRLDWCAPESPTKTQFVYGESS